MALDRGMKCEAIIWDLDGVLVDSLELRIAALADASRQAGVPLPSQAELRRWLCHGPREALRKMPGAGTSLRPFEQFCRKSATQYLAAFTDINQTVNGLDRMGLRQALVTSRTRSDTDRWLDLCQVPKTFEVQITHSDRLRSKPNPDGLLAAAERLAVRPEDCAYLGDTVHDGVACERAGVAFLLAGWGTPDAAEVLANVSPRAVIDNPTDVLLWVSEDRS